MNLDSRRYTLIFIVLFVGVVYIIRLFFLQVTSQDLKDKAVKLTEKEEIIYPSRGIIYDRNGKVLVANQTVFDLMVIPTETLPMDTDAFCKLVNVSKTDLRKFFKRIAARGERRLKHVFIEQITPPEFAAISEELYKYPGYFAETRTLRVYPQQTGALVLGDVGKISEDEYKANPYYTKRDYIGKSGIEKAYERELRGTRGVKYLYRDNKGVVRGVAEGRLDSAAIAGQNLWSTIDAELQSYGEKLMAKRRGCIVAIEPKTGEVLCLVSAPTYDPNLLVGRARGHNFEVLKADKNLPLYNRATQAEYRPGSIFKLAQSLVALEVKAITPQTRIHCNRGIIGCHGSHSFDDLEMAIVHSCNPYFREVMHRVVEGDRDKTSRFIDARLGLDIWANHMKKFGFGTDLGSDIPNVKIGLVPDPDFYDDEEDWYGKYRWAYSTIYSLSIGEGEMQVTPLQMCNLACIIANRGYFISPHTVKSIGETGRPRDEFLERHYVGIDTAHFTTVINAMEKVVGPGGTANSSKLKDIIICGKTGTVEYPKPLKDHAVFICFAPKDDPQIALAVYTEHAGFGGTWSAPVASLMIEKYLNDTITETAREKRMLEVNLLDNKNSADEMEEEE